MSGDGSSGRPPARHGAQQARPVHLQEHEQEQRQPQAQACHQIELRRCLRIGRKPGPYCKPGEPACLAGETRSLQLHGARRERQMHAEPDYWRPPRPESAQTPPSAFQTHRHHDHQHPHQRLHCRALPLAPLSGHQARTPQLRENSHKHHRHSLNHSHCHSLNVNNSNNNNHLQPRERTLALVAILSLCALACLCVGAAGANAASSSAPGHHSDELHADGAGRDSASSDPAARRLSDLVAKSSTHSKAVPRQRRHFQFAHLRARPERPRAFPADLSRGGDPEARHAYERLIGEAQDGDDENAAAAAEDHHGQDPEDDLALAVDDELDGARQENAIGARVAMRQQRKPHAPAEHHKQQQQRPRARQWHARAEQERREDAGPEVPYVPPVVVSISDNSFVSAAPPAGRARARRPHPRPSQRRSRQHHVANHGARTPESQAQESEGGGGEATGTPTSTTATTTSNASFYYANGGPAGRPAGGGSVSDSNDSNDSSELSLFESEKEAQDALSRLEAGTRVAIRISDQMRDGAGPSRRRPVQHHQPAPGGAGGGSGRALDYFEATSALKQRPAGQAADQRPVQSDAGSSSSSSSWPSPWPSSPSSRRAPEYSLVDDSQLNKAEPADAKALDLDDGDDGHSADEDAKDVDDHDDDDDDDDEDDEDEDDEDDDADDDGGGGDEDDSANGLKLDQSPGRRRADNSFESRVRLEPGQPAGNPVRYSHIISSPKNELPSYGGGGGGGGGARFWHAGPAHRATIQLVQEDPEALRQPGGLDSAIIGILVGIGATGMLVLLVSFKMGTIRERVAYKGRRRSLVPDTDFLINTIPI